MQLSTISLALTRLGGLFSPAALFAGGTVAGAWYDPSDLSTLFTTSAGTTPVAMPGLGAPVSVGLMLDKSQGLVLGPELVTAPYSGAVSGGFSITSTSVVRDGVTAGGTASLTLSTTLTANALHQVTFTAAGLSGDNTIIRVGSTVSGNFYRITTAGTYTIYLPAGGTAAILGIAPFVGSAGGITLTNISVKALPGNHAIAFNDTTARPELRARVNLLTYSEDQSNGVWINYSATQQSNVGTAPDGTNTADRIVEIAGSNLQARYQAIAGGLSISHTVSAYAKADQRNVFNLSYSGVGNTNWFAATFELTGNGSVTKTGAGAAGTYTSSSITPVGNGWYFCTVTGNPGQASTHYVYGGPSDTNSPTYGNFGVLTYSGNTANGVLVWGFDVRPTNIGANVPAYQRIADANTYDTSGFPLYLRFDGIDDSMYTPANLNLSGTDKVAVFAGVRKLSDAVQVYTELSADYNANNGTFLLWSNSSPNALYFDSKGTTIRSAQDPATAAAPASFVLTGQGNISAPSVTLRKNGTQVASNTSSQGTGNYGSYPLFVGSRNNASFLSVANIYSLIIAGSAVSAGNISATEQWVAGKTGIVIP